MILPIVAYGDPVLRKEAQEISNDYPKLNELIENMFETSFERTFEITFERSPEHVRKCSKASPKSCSKQV